MQIFKIKVFNKKREKHITSPSLMTIWNDPLIIEETISIEVSSNEIKGIFADDTGIFRAALQEIELPTLVKEGQILGIIEPIYFGELVEPTLIEAKEEGILISYLFPDYFKFSYWTHCSVFNKEYDLKTGKVTPFDKEDEHYLKTGKITYLHRSFAQHGINKGSCYVETGQRVITFCKYKWSNNEKLQKLFW